MSEKSASQVRQEEADMLTARMAMIQSGPVARAEKVAKHYVAHVMVAQHCLRLIEMLRLAGPSQPIEAMIAECLQTMERNHRYDLGSEL